MPRLPPDCQGEAGHDTVRSVRLVLTLLCIAAVHAQPEWKPLFDGKTLGQWKATPFANSPPPRVENGSIQLTAGHPLTGITWSGRFPDTAYELRFEATRLLGGDFFASV